MSVTARASLLFADRQRTRWDFDDHPAVLDDDRIDLQRQLGRRVERLAVGQVEPRQVEGASDGACGQEALVELEILVATDALRGGELAAVVDDEDLVV